MVAPAVNRALAAAWMTTAAIAGCWLLAQGLRAGVLGRRIRGPFGRGYYEGRAAVVEGAFRMAVGVALIGSVVWVVVLGAW